MAKNDKSAKKSGADAGTKAKHGAAEGPKSEAATGEPAKKATAPKPAPMSAPPAGSMLAKMMEAQRKKRDENRAKNEGKVSDHSATRSREFGPLGGPKVGDGPKGGAGAMRRTAPGA